MKDTMIRAMTIEDYDQVTMLWGGIKGFGIRSLDDSKEGIARFLRRNPYTSVVAVKDGKIIGSILCGHDGRQGCFYHVCVDEAFRQQGIGRMLVDAAVTALKKEHINRIYLIAFTKNTTGNAFWQRIGWNCREDCNYYDLILNEENATTFIG